MKNKEYEQAPKKDSKSLHLVIGIVIGAVIATVIILVVLFATGVIGGEKESTTTANAPETTAAAEKDTTAKPSEENTPSASNGKYKEFRVKNATIRHYNKNDDTASYTTEDIIVQIPYMKEFEELGLDLDKLEIDTEDSVFIKDGKITETLIYVSDGTQQFPLIAIICDGNEILYDNILMMYFDCWFTDPETGLEKGFDGRYLGTDNLVWVDVYTDYANKIGYGKTISGCHFENGTYYDYNNNIISQEDYWTYSNNADEEALVALESSGCEFYDF